MPRKKKSDKLIGRFSETDMKEAVELVIDKGYSVRLAASAKGLAFQTVSRYVKKFKNDSSARMFPNYKVNQIFPSDVEKSLCDYLITCSKMFYGLTIKDCRLLAYELAVKNHLCLPETWKNNKMASLDWMKGFRKRFPVLSLRTPEGCSLSRATAFNKFNVSSFFDKLEEVYSRNPNFSSGHRVFNLDETGTVTVQKSHKILAGKGTKQVSKATSAERGTLVTTCCIVNALGQCIPPVMVFPRVHFKEHMISGSPNGTLGLATKGGWMNSECFVHAIHHFIKYSASSKENPSLLIIDNHESHLSIEAINLCKENGITLLTVPPHCTHKLQPLDVSLMKPFHTFYDSAVDSWMMSHPGETFSIYNVASCVGIAYPRAMTPVNIAAGFRKTGIYPFDRHVFTEEDFLPSVITDRSLHSSEESCLPSSEVLQIKESIPSSSNATSEDHISSQLTDPESLKPFYLSPEQIRGYPKAKPRKQTNSRRGRKGKTMIATDTPEKNAIEQKRKKKEPKVTTVRKRLYKKREDDSESDVDDLDYILDDSSDGDLYSSDEEQAPLVPVGDNNKPEKDDFVLVEFTTKQKIFYVGKVNNINASNEYEIAFMRRSVKFSGNFVFPLVPDVSTVCQEDIKFILPKPITHGKTKRQQSFISFQVNLDSFNVR